MMAAESEVDAVSVYCLVESTQISMCPRVPVLFALACTTSDFEEIEAPFAAVQICTPGEVGALHWREQRNPARTRRLSANCSDFTPSPMRRAVARCPRIRCC